MITTNYMIHYFGFNFDRKSTYYLLFDRAPELTYDVFYEYRQRKEREEIIAEETIFVHWVEVACKRFETLR